MSKNEPDSNLPSPLLPEFRDLARQRDPLFTAVDFVGWILILGTTWMAITVTRGCFDFSATKPTTVTNAANRSAADSVPPTATVPQLKQILGDIDPERLPEHAQNVVEHAREITAEQLDSPPEWFKVMTNYINALSEWTRGQFGPGNGPQNDRESDVE